MGRRVIESRYMKALALRLFPLSEERAQRHSIEAETEEQMSHEGALLQ
jgi:hypothetical protein